MTDILSANPYSCCVRPACFIAFIWVASVSTCFADDSGVRKAIENLDSVDRRIRSDAAEVLATQHGPTIIPALRTRLATERHFHVALAINYALAAHGFRENLRPLIDSLERSGHLGVVYLERVCDERFGWEREAWEDWYESRTNAQFRSLIERRLARKPMMDELSRFSRSYTGSIFGHVLDIDAGEENHFRRKITEKESQDLVELPTAKAWAVFQNALNELQKRGDRAEAARLFHQIEQDYSATYYAEVSTELAQKLDEMVVEDKEFEFPKEILALPLEQQIAVHIHNLRDVVASQFSQPGHCLIIQQLLPSENAAFALRDIGEPAVPYLIELLEDRRPIRAVGYWRDYSPTRTVLRYQDAAIQVINEIRENHPYRRRTSSSYFSVEKERIRKEIIASLRASVNSPAIKNADQ